MTWLLTVLCWNFMCGTDTALPYGDHLIWESDFKMEK